MKLVDNWKKAWTWISMWCMGIANALLAAWVLLPEDFKPAVVAMMSTKEVAIAVMAILVIGKVGRLVDQSPKNSEDV